MDLRSYFVKGDVSQLLSYRFHRNDSIGTDGNLKKKRFKARLNLQHEPDVHTHVHKLINVHLLEPSDIQRITHTIFYRNIDVIDRPFHQQQLENVFSGGKTQHKASVSAAHTQIMSHRTYCTSRNDITSHNRLCLH